jgi:hypothetical protein
MAARKLKSFTSSKSKKKAEPIEFELEDQKFIAYGEVSGAVLLDFIAAAGSDSSADTAVALMTYLKRSMDKENWARFDKLIHDPEVLIELETLSEIVSALIEERSESRPTEAS